METMSEFEMLVTLAYSEPVAPLELTGRADELVDAMRTHAGDIAFGPAVATHWSRQEIDLLFTVEAADADEATGKGDRVIALIEEHTPNELANVKSAPAKALCA